MKTLALNKNLYFLNNSNKAERKNSESLNKKSLYWSSQIVGWFLFVAVNLAMISTFDEVSVKRVLVWIAWGLCGILFTHLYRLYIKKHNWTSLPLKKIIPRVLIASFLIAIIIFSFVYFSGYWLQVRKEYTNLISFIATGVLNATSIVIGWSLIYFSVHFFESSKRSEIESLIFEAAVKDFELKTLKAQLNPHFMFNAMNSIRALIEEDPKSAKDAITKLSNLLRYTLKIERTESVTLGEELKTIQDYLDLEKIRFEERLRYTIKSTTEADRVEIPPMMVQTLVENGIKHGISKITNGGEISVDARTNTSDLIIEIRNNGNFDEELFKSSRGFGISNTKHRLTLLYGEKGSLNLTNENNNIVLTKLIIPIGGFKQ